MNTLKKESATEEAILDAARKIFEQNGFIGARMQQISRESGINKALLHYYFRSKEKLFERIFDEALTQVDHLFSTWEKPEREWKDQLRHFITRLFEYLQENSMLFILREISRKPELLK